MLFTQGNELIRIQCAFVDTPEIQKITEFIGSQKAYASAYMNFLNILVKKAEAQWTIILKTEMFYLKMLLKLS